MAKVFFEGLAVGIVAATVFIIAFEIVRNYSLGDKVKDLFVSAEKREEAIYNRARDRFHAAQAKLAAKLRKVF